MNEDYVASLILKLREEDLKLVHETFAACRADGRTDLREVENLVRRALRDRECPLSNPDAEDR